MNPEILNYLAGIFDGEGTVSVQVFKDNRHRYGIRIKPYIQFAISKDDADVIDLFKKYIPVKWVVGFYKSRNIIHIRIEDLDGIRKFIEVLSPYIRLPSTKKKVEIMSKILQKMNKHRKPYSKEEFLELLMLAKELRMLQKRRNFKKITNIDEIISKIKEEG